MKLRIDASTPVLRRYLEVDEAGVVYCETAALGGVRYIDYKDINLLRRFMSDRAKIRARRVTGNDAQQQREVARAIKNAREMALLAYTTR